MSGSFIWNSSSTSFPSTFTVVETPSHTHAYQVNPPEAYPSFQPSLNQPQIVQDQCYLIPSQSHTLQGYNCQALSLDHLSNAQLQPSSLARSFPLTHAPALSMNAPPPLFDIDFEDDDIASPPSEHLILPRLCRIEEIDEEGGDTDDMVKGNGNSHRNSSDTKEDNVALSGHEACIIPEINAEFRANKNGDEEGSDGNLLALELYSGHRKRKASDDLEESLGDVHGSAPRLTETKKVKVDDVDFLDAFNYDPVAELDEFDVTRLTGPWEELQAEIVEKLQEFAEQVIENAYDLVLDVSYTLHTINAEAQNELESGVQSIKAEERKHRAAVERMANFLRQMEMATKSLTASDDEFGM